MSDPVAIPLLRRDGEVVAHTLVDAADATDLTKHTWRFDPHRNVAFRGGSRSLYLMHRVIMGLEAGDGLEVDHINGDRLDNRRQNLRVVTHAQNMQNRGTWGEAGFRGVKRHRNRWRATATVAGRTYRLGHYATAEEAARVASEFRLQHMPFTNENRRAA